MPIIRQDYSGPFLVQPIIDALDELIEDLKVVEVSFAVNSQTSSTANYKLIGNGLYAIFTGTISLNAGTYATDLFTSGSYKYVPLATSNAAEIEKLFKGFVDLEAGQTLSLNGSILFKEQTVKDQNNNDVTVYFQNGFNSTFLYKAAKTSNPENDPVYLACSIGRVANTGSSIVITKNYRLIHQICITSGVYEHLPEPI